MPKQSLLASSAVPSSGRLAVTYEPIGSLTLDPRNARQHSKKQIGQIARSIQAFGFSVPILADKDGNVIAGHGRLLACRKLGGMTDVPTVKLDHLTPAQVQAFKLADNKLAENATWDDQLLGEALRDLSVLDLDFDLEITGFNTAEIDLHIGNLQRETVADADRADEVPAVQDVAITRPGDLWVLGAHRVLCGSALEEASYEVLLGNTLAKAAFSDPPYNVPIKGHVSGLGARTHREFAMATGEMSEGEFTSFLATACRLMARYSKPGSLHFLCIDWRHMGELQEAARSAYCQLKNVCVWVKDNAAMGSLYRSQHELVFVFKNGTDTHQNNVELGRHGRHRTNVWQYPGVNSFGRNGREGNLLAMHPTVKPVAMIADAILDCTSRGDVVLDGFLGSGSTVIAAEKTGRRCFGLELDQLYTDTIVRRWQAYTGGTAHHATTGESFDAIAGKRPSDRPDPSRSLFDPEEGNTDGE